MRAFLFKRFCTGRGGSVMISPSWSEMIPSAGKASSVARMKVFSGAIFDERRVERMEAVVAGM